MNDKAPTQKIGQMTRDWARACGVGVIYTESTGSTNTDARLFDGRFEKLNVIITDLQTHGRGRGDHAWETPQSGNYLLSSWVKDLDAAPQPVFSPRVGLSLYQSLKATWPVLPLSLKAPNDIFLETQKVAGLLIEVISQSNRHRVIVGLGLNVSSVPHLSTATFLESFLGRKILGQEWDTFLDFFSKKMDQHFLTIDQKTLTYQECEDLRSALNLFEPLKDQVLTVQPNASLTLKNKNINWDEL